MEEQPIQQPNLQPTQPEIKRPFTKKVFLILGVVVLGLIVGGGVIVMSRQNRTAQVYPTPTIGSSTVSPEPMVDWRTYSDSEYGVTFQYPGEWQILEQDTSGHPLGYYRRQLYFLVKPDDKSEVLVPTLFSVILYKSFDEVDFLAYTKGSIVIDEFKDLPTQSEDVLTITPVMLGGKPSTLYNYLAGMNYGRTELIQSDTKGAVILGSEGGQFGQMEEPYKPLGNPPYINNEVFNKIVSSFQFTK